MVIFGKNLVFPKFGGNGPKWPKNLFFQVFIKILSIDVYFFHLKSCSIMFFTIQRKLHVWEKSGSRVIAPKALGQSDCSIFQIWISQELFDHLSWCFVWWCNTIRGIQWKYSWWLLCPGLTHACPTCLNLTDIAWELFRPQYLLIMIWNEIFSQIPSYSTVFRADFWNYSSDISLFQPQKALCQSECLIFQNQNLMNYWVSYFLFFNNLCFAHCCYFKMWFLISGSKYWFIYFDVYYWLFFFNFILFFFFNYVGPLVVDLFVFILPLFFQYGHFISISLWC